MNVRFRFYIPFLALAFLVLLSSCDSAENTESVFLQKKATFTFRFAANNAGQGKPITIESDEEVNFEGELDGFSKEEIVSAAVASVSMMRIQPAGVNLDAILSQAAVEIGAGGMTGKQVANLASVPANDVAGLTPTNAGDVSPYLARPSFSAVLRLTPKELTLEENYSVQVVITFQIEVEGV